MLVNRCSASVRITALRIGAYAQVITSPGKAHATAALTHTDKQYPQVNNAPKNALCRPIHALRANVISDATIISVAASTAKIAMHQAAIDIIDG
jgi:hypothetical protein